MGAKPSYKELEERCRHLTTIIDNAADLISEHDHTGLFRYASPAVFDLTGYRPEELVGRNAYDFIHADDIENVRRGHRQIQKASVVTSVIYRFRHKRGHFVWLETTSKIVRNSLSGQTAEIIATTRDIAERVAAEKELAQRLELEHLISDVSSKFLVLSVKEMDRGLDQALGSIGRLAEAERASIFLFRADEAIVDNTHEWCASGVEPQIAHRRAILLAEKLPWFSARVHRREIFTIPDIAGLPGEARAERELFEAQGILSLVAVPMAIGGRLLGFIELDAVSAGRTWPDEDLAVIRFLGELFANTIERRHAETKLRESEQRWQFALEGAGDGVWDWNAVTQQVYFSRQWKAMLGFAEEEIGNGVDEWERRVYPDDLEAVRADLDRHLRGLTDAYQNEHRMRCKDGKYKWILDRGKVIEWTPEGNPLRVIGTHSDISDRKKAEAEREKLIGELREALTRVKALSGLLPICIICKRIRDDQGYWNQIESYIRDHSEAEFSHSLCAECAKRHYPELDLDSEE